MPLKIYLDTQDYLNLYKNRTPEQQNIYDYLCSKIDANEIVIGFSFPIISEILQDYTAEHKEDRILRAKIIKRMCRNNCYSFISVLRRKDSFNSLGNWYPPIGNFFDLEKMKKIIKVEFMNIIKNEIPYIKRSQLRKVTEWPNILKFIRGNRLAFNNIKIDEALKIPIPPKFIEENMLIKYLLGEMERKTLEKEFLQIMTDVELFIETWFEYGKKGNYMYDQMQTVNAGYEKIILTSRLAAEPISEIKKGIRDMEKKVFKGELPKSFLEDTKDLKRKTKSVAELIDENIAKIRSNRETSKHFPESFFNAFSIYIHHQSKTNTPIKVSDAADLMHACYIPYCDLWRGDKAFSTTLINGEIEGKEKIVTSLLDLPERIEFLLEKEKNFPLN